MGVWFPELEASALSTVLCVFLRVKGRYIDGDPPPRAEPQKLDRGPWSWFCWPPRGCGWRVAEPGVRRR